MARKASPSDYSHTSILKDVTKDEHGKTVNISAPYGSADIARNGDVISVRYWDKEKEKKKAKKTK